MSTEDARGRLIALTELGRRVVDETFTDHIANEHRLMAGLSERDRADLERALTRWLVLLGDHDRQPVARSSL